MTNGIDPFWNAVIDAHEQVATHPQTKVEVSRDQRVAQVYFDPDVQKVVIIVSLNNKQELENG